VNKITLAVATLILFLATTASAEHAYIDFDDDGNMVLSGPFDIVIPRPDGARLAQPQNTDPNFLNEHLKVSKAGYFADDQFVIVQVETTNAPAGTLTNKNLPIHELAGREFRARTACLDISQEELDADDNPLFEYIETQNVQIVPSVQAIQLFVTTDDGTGEGIILYMRHYAGGCDAMTDEVKSEFHDAFERFIATIRDANETA
jgi:hypothetical protein